jgi:hypothetical protein
LQQTVHLFLEWFGHRADSLEAIAERIAAIDLAALRGEHWFADAAPLSVNGTDHAKPLGTLLGRRALCPATLGTRLAFPGVFNQDLARLPTKADVEWRLIEGLLSTILSEPGDWREAVVWVDRLGGRRFYRSQVEELAGDDFPLTLEESAKRSAYQFQSAGRKVTVSFEVKADQRRLPVALASMVAKYLRECSMDGLNRFWARHIPDLKPTAGYPGDARRYLQQIEPFLGPLGIPKTAVWRDR